MIKFNVAFLIVALTCFSAHMFGMGEGQEGKGLGDSQFEQLPPAPTNQVIPGQNGELAQLEAGNSTNKLEDAELDEMLPPKHKSKAIKSVLSYFTKTRAAITALIIGAAGYLAYKYFAEKKEKEQNVNEIVS